MSHFRISDQIIDHPQFIDLPPRAIVLWLFATAWCQRHLSDGRIPKPAMHALPKYTPKIIRNLVQKRLVIELEFDYELVGFLKHNDSRETTEKRRKRWAERQSKRRDAANVTGGLTGGVTRAVTAQIRSRETYKEHKSLAPAVRPARRVQWFIECEELHGRTCIHRSHHELLMRTARATRQG